MGIGTRNISIGPRIGIGMGGSASVASMANVSLDATSGKYCPATAGEWVSTMAVSGIGGIGPSLLWLCQDASGNLADAIGAFTATVTGAPLTYQAAITGWSRFGITGGDAGTGAAASTSGGLPDPASASTLMLGYAISALPAAQRNMQIIGSANSSSSQVRSTNTARLVSGVNSAIGVSNMIGQVRPIVLLYDVTGNRALLYTDQDKISTTRFGATGKSLQLSFSFPGSWLYACAFFGSAAELSDAQVKTLLQTLNWTIPWS